MSAWIHTATGQQFHLGGIGRTVNRIDLHDIAHALAQINRFTGHATRPYSVAEHSLLCADIAERMQCTPAVQRAALLHDAHEAYTGDCSSPAKQVLGAAWADYEGAHAQAVRKHFRVHHVFVGCRPVLHQIDLVALATERRDLMAWSADTHPAWDVLDTPGRVVPPADWINLQSLKREHKDWTEWRDAFLERYHALGVAVEQWAKESAS